MKRFRSLFLVVMVLLSAFSAVPVNADASTISVAAMELTLSGGEDYVYVEWTEVEDAVKYEFEVMDNGYTDTIVSEKPFLKWWPYNYFVMIGVKAFDASGNLIGESMQEDYFIDVINADWWGPCGDANLDWDVNIKDATYIQKYAADLVVFSVINKKAADADGNGSIDVRDATTIQKFLAGISVESQIYRELWHGWTEYRVHKA